MNRILLSLTVGVVLWACTDAGSPQIKRPIAARIDGIPIYQDEFEAYFSRLQVQTKNGEPEAVGAEAHRRVALQDLIEQRILLHEARSKKVVVSTSAVDAAYRRQTEGYRESDFAAELQRLKVNEAELRREIRDRLLVEQYFDDVVFSRLVITDQEVDAYLDEHPKIRSASEQIRLSQIVVKTEDEAKDILRELRRNLSFEEAALKYSLTPEKVAGGDLGMIERGTLPTALEEVAFSLRVGSVSTVVQSEYGFHLLKVASRRRESERPDVEVRRDVERILLREKKSRAQYAHLEALKKRVQVDMGRL